MIRSPQYRILIIDDNPSIHEDFRKILDGGLHERSSLDDKETLLFGEPAEQAEQPEQAEQRPSFEIDSAFGGEQGLEMVLHARQQGRPYALAFVDVRMPPGIDGVETIEQIWPVDTDLQMVICSAYSDYSAGDILERLGVSDRLLMLRKPCDMAEILLIATAMCRKWQLAQASTCFASP